MENWKQLIKYKLYMTITLRGDCRSPGKLPAVVRTFLQKLSRKCSSSKVFGMPGPNDVSFCITWKGNIYHMPDAPQVLERYKRHMANKEVELLCE